ncbi:D-alanyl-D-alanine carboxypeptidase/D-alanyl-D-alanine-endopeptidase [Sulfurovum sp. ST-21]|uniref:D-alanyl-D-alanine carboxypeptidase/D-alanyl-D-alanine-endopeptidase n=1 Tax=Sulfurovum indicum TaxID=2779528 RepID=A0A7M1S3I7_9BACT|nr:D-alanyl-D-alanine carboxypeptidase/D-alanyl-D-alanine-endopeptidase [Sulfurovum indicum]QOR61561.1 D-alanyl-D-alanine carboxypeptidase/D-alanyl-D-alanine-endopeptidase [Sulfurovum indicum]
MKRLVLFFMFASYWIYALPGGIETAIKRSGIPKKDISLYIKEAGESNTIVASLNASETRTPASVIKVFTAYSAVLELGFEYRWPTQFYIHGRLKNGVLQGDLVVKGFGDPTFGTDDLDDIITEIQTKGIRKITGNIVIDRSYFKVGTKNSSKFDENPYSPYNAMPDAMMFNERVSTICVEPKKNTVTKKDPDGSYIIRNQLQRVNKPCRGKYSWPRVTVDDSKAVSEVWIKGKISKRCGKRTICQVVTQPYKSFYYLLKDALEKAGIEFHGGMRLRKVPKDAKILFIHYSPPLEKIISKTSKKSNNLYARHLLLFLGAKLHGAPATVDKGRGAVIQILREQGVPISGMVKIDNGSGLSRSAKINAKSLAAMLDHAYERYGQRWMNTLSVAGVDGTIKKRFRGTIVRNRAWMKTGTLRRVKNIAGYVKSRKGRYYTAVIIINTKHAKWKAAKLQDNIIQWLVQYNGKAGVSGRRSKSDALIVSNAVKKNSANRQSAPSRRRKLYYIQTGSFSRSPGKAYLSKIKRLHFSYLIRNGPNYKVLIGPFGSEAAARDALKKIRSTVNHGAFLIKESDPKK